MFTGIVEEIGIIKEIRKNKRSCQVKIKASKVLEGTILGDSIAINGVCLTVTNLTNDTFDADIVSETLKRSNLGELSIGSKVNLERALRLSDRLGGHIVTGHIDCKGEIISFYKDENATWVTIKPKEKILKYIVEKGSVTIDGISLTVAYVDKEKFVLSIIPHTGSETTLLEKRIGNLINIECDVVGKYIESFLNPNNSNVEDSGINKTSINENFLIKNGFM